MEIDFECHPAVAEVLRQFKVDHLPDGEHREIVGWFCKVAYDLAKLAPKSANTTHALRSIMSAKDDALRAYIFRDV